MNNQQIVRKLSRGFTLLELLVTISIIALLIAMAAVAYSNAQKKGRDARRVGDVKAIQAAIEQYAANNGGVYTADTCLTTMPLGGGLSLVPQDPQGGNYVNNTCTATDYCVCANVEGNKGNYSDNNCASAVNGTGDFFCVTELQ